MIVGMSLFSKFHFQNIFCSHENIKPAFFKILRFQKLLFHDGLVCTSVDDSPNSKIQLRFQISRT